MSAAAPRADDAQRTAADPGGSVWVDASAGSGKTTVLVNRVLRLLLGAGAEAVEPQRILCLTFTKAAAAEMANRLNGRLADWAVASDAELTAELETLTGARPDPALRALARRLLARVLETPGGMRIQTIHAFCQSALRRFPLEANVPPHFEVMDERDAKALMHDVQNEIIAGGAGPDLRGALDTVTRNVHETRLTDLLAELARERGRVQRAIREAGGLDGLIDRLHEEVGIPRGTAPEDTTRAACAPGADAEKALRALANAMRAHGSPTDRQRGNALAAWLDSGADDRFVRFDAYRGIFLTKQGARRAKPAAKAVFDAAPETAEAAEAEADRLLAAEQERRRAVVAGATAALLTFGATVLNAYETRKRGLGKFDYDDLILAARDMLADPGRAAWALYKIDGGLDHILIDEAQDTNPDQWEIVRALTGEFFAGEGARDTPRTLFAVGDPKQSIYRFQRADPEKFVEMRRRFAAGARGAKLPWKEAPLEFSFRSVEPVLAAVDAAFAQPGADSGVRFEGREVRHEARRKGQEGLVELRPPTVGDAAEPPAPWKPPVERIAPRAADELLAAELAERIRGICNGGAWLASRDRLAEPGDVLVLVRRRNRFMYALVRRLKLAGVPVAGVDRLVLTEHIAVMDLMALGRFALFPDDDLSLAEALKSPLFGFDDDTLFAAAHGRERRSLWQALREKAKSSGAPFAGAAERLRESLRAADRKTPFEFYADILAGGGGRRRFLARLGGEAAEPLDEFLAQALAYERANAPSLQGFLHWLESGDTDVKRDPGAGGGNAVRAMTVHGAKGMEAPIVILPDTVQPPRTRSHLVWAPDGRLVLWPVRKDDWDALATEWRESADRGDRDEYRRLLYVAMTRAEDRLLVCGWQSGKKQDPESWHSVVAGALQALPEAEAGAAEEEGAEPVLTLRSAQTEAPDRAAPADAPPPDAAPERPGWMDRPPPAETTAGERRRSARSRPAWAPEAEARGRRLHRLLQLWPNLPPDTAESERAAVEETVALVRRDPVFAPIFGPDALPEAAVAAPGAQAGFARIDRVAITPDAALAVDFKSGGAPEDVARPPKAYLQQMAAYRSALADIFPGKPIRCALVWIDRCALAPLDAASLARAAPPGPAPRRAP